MLVVEPQTNLSLPDRSSRLCASPLPLAHEPLFPLLLRADSSTFCSVLTLAATPLALAFYPPHVRPSARDAASSSDSKDLARSSSSIDKPGFGGVSQQRTRFAIVLDQLEALGGAMVLTNLLAAGSSTAGPSSSTAAAPAGAEPSTLKTDDALLTASSATATASATSAPRAPTAGPSSTAPLSVTPLRLVELTERTSGVMLASEEAATHLARDPLVALVRTFASLFAGRVALERGEFAMTGLENWAETVARCAKEGEQDMLLLSWRLGGGKGEIEQPGMVESFRASFRSLLLSASLSLSPLLKIR